jgi:predicted RNase H-like nuclease (RuvC/YqgF family)
MSYNATYNKTYNNNDEWVTLKEASKTTGKSLNAIRMLVHRKKISSDRIKKVTDNGRNYWMVHRDALNLIYNSSMSSDICNSDILQPVTPVICQDNMSDICQDSIPIYYHDQKLKEWQQERDSLMQGLMMYRYKFEELDRQMRLLPAPVENIPAKLSELESKAAELAEKDQVLRESQDAIQDLETSAAEKDQSLARSQETIKALEEALHREKQRSWWDRLWKK